MNTPTKTSQSILSTFQQDTSERNVTDEYSSINLSITYRYNFTFSLIKIQVEIFFLSTIHYLVYPSRCMLPILAIPWPEYTEPCPALSWK